MGTSPSALMSKKDTRIRGHLFVVFYTQISGIYADFWVRSHLVELAIDSESVVSTVVWLGCLFKDWFAGVIGGDDVGGGDSSEDGGVKVAGSSEVRLVEVEHYKGGWLAHF